MQFATRPLLLLQTSWRDRHEWRNTIVKHPFAPVPNYRFANHCGTLTSYAKDDDTYKDLVKALPGFEIETGMACSLGNLFHLYPFLSGIFFAHAHGTCAEFELRSYREKTAQLHTSAQDKHFHVYHVINLSTLYKSII
jgi:hypothetical protein